MSCSFEMMGGQCGEAEEGPRERFGAETEILFYLFQAPDTPHLAFPSSSPLLIFSALVFCYVTEVIGCARGCAAGTSNGTSGRSKAREARSEVKRHRLMLFQALKKVFLYQEVFYSSTSNSLSVYPLCQCLH